MEYVGKFALNNATNRLKADLKQHQLYSGPVSLRELWDSTQIVTRAERGRRVREKVGFYSDWLRKKGEFFKPIRKLGKAGQKQTRITFDTQSKTGV